MGGRFKPPITSTRACGSTAARAAMAASTRSASASSVTRMSTWTRACAGTTLSAVPACATVVRHRRAHLGAPDGRDGEHLVRRLDQRVDTLLGLEPGVGGTAVHDHVEVARALAPRS
jgi:hypothetical protein